MPFIDNELANSAIDLTDLQDPEILETLKTYDTDHNKEITLTELKGETVKTPISRQDLYIKNQDTFNIYHGLLKGNSNASRFFQTTTTETAEQSECVNYNTENWILSSFQKLIGKSYITAWSEFYLYDIQNENDNISLLMKHGKSGTDKDFYFTVSFNMNLETLQVEVENNVYDLNQQSNIRAIEKFRGRVLSALFVFFTNPVEDLSMPEQNRFRDHFELRMLQAREKMFDDVDDSEEDEENLSLELKERISQLEKGQFPSRIPYFFVKNSNGDTITLPWRGEKSLSQRLSQNFQKLLDSLPATLIDNLQSNGLFKDFKFEIIEDDLMDAVHPNWRAYHSSSKRLIAIRKSLLQPEEFIKTRRTLIHELGHRIHPRKGDDYIEELYKESKESLAKDFNFFLSPYASSSKYEFFAECVLAYFNGEKDPNPVASSYQGPKDLSELRVKQPELYIAIRLFFEKSHQLDGYFYGNYQVFSKDFKTILDELLNDSPVVLYPGLSIDEILSITGWKMKDILIRLNPQYAAN